MLDQIVRTKKDEIQQLGDQFDAANVQHYSLYEAIEKQKPDIALIAEVKKASPSKGVIKENFQPVEIAKGYQQSGATAVSVLTDQHYFQGHPNYVTAIKEAISLPVLRKDFIIDHKQIKESRAIGADALLLIAAILSPNQLHELYANAHESGLDVLVEVHNRDELERLLATFTPKLIGVNNRDLNTFTTSLEVTQELARHIPASSLFVSESGIHSSEDVQFVQAQGAHAILVGESLMAAESQDAAVKELIGDRK
jgi:indole-3-glycerol phosphate synthase